MNFNRTMLLYRLLLPLYVMLALPGWLHKTLRRGGWGRELCERFGIFRDDPEFEPCGVVHVHAVSVGETLLALKLINAWRERDGAARFVLAVTTASARVMAAGMLPEGVRLVYQPVDFRLCVAGYLDRFEPAEIVLVEGEMWPHLMQECTRRGIRVRLVNARMSPRSRRRYERLASWVEPVFGQLQGVALQEAADVGIWMRLGVAGERIVVTGSLKFDPGAARRGSSRPEFRAMVASLSSGRPVLLGASTHAGEERLIAAAARAAGAFCVLIPRHAERRHEVAADLARDGWMVVLRSRFEMPAGDAILVVDSTGELRDWIEEADLVVVGKSFTGTGGQNPAEAVVAGKPVVFGPHMENFEPLAASLVDAGGALRVDAGSLAGSLGELLADKPRSMRMAAEATGVLQRHAGATGRLLDWLDAGKPAE